MHIRSSILAGFSFFPLPSSYAVDNQRFPSQEPATGLSSSYLYYYPCVQDRMAGILIYFEASRDRRGYLGYEAHAPAQFTRMLYTIPAHNKVVPNFLLVFVP